MTTKQSNQWVYFYKKEDVIGNLEVPDEALSLKKQTKKTPHWWEINGAMGLLFKIHSV